MQGFPAGFILHFSLFLRPRLLHRIASPLGVYRGLRGNHPTPSTEGVNACRVFVGYVFGVETSHSFRFSSLPNLANSHFMTQPRRGIPLWRHDVDFMTSSGYRFLSMDLGQGPSFSTTELCPCVSRGSLGGLSIFLVPPLWCTSEAFHSQTNWFNRSGFPTA